MLKTKCPARTLLKKEQVVRKSEERTFKARGTDLVARARSKNVDSVIFVGWFEKWKWLRHERAKLEAEYLKLLKSKSGSSSLRAKELKEQLSALGSEIGRLVVEMNREAKSMQEKLKK